MKAPIYRQFTDKQGNEYKFDNYMMFARWWFNLPHKQQTTFPQYKKLQFAAANSKEARTKMY